MKYISGMIFLDGSPSMRAVRNDGTLTALLKERLNPLMEAVTDELRETPARNLMEAISMAPKTCAGGTFYPNQPKLAACVTNGEYEEGAETDISKALADLPDHVFVVIVTVGAVKVPARELFNTLTKHPDFNKKFTVVRDYAGEQLSGVFAQVIAPFRDRVLRIS